MTEFRGKLVKQEKWNYFNVKYCLNSITLIFILYLVIFAVDLREINLEKVPGLDGMKIVDMATGAEHSVIVTGKI